MRPGDFQDQIVCFSESTPSQCLCPADGRSRRKAAIAGRENGRRKLGGERVFRESDSTFIGDWHIPLGVVVFVTTLGREAAGNLIDVAARV